MRCNNHIEDIVRFKELKQSKKKEKERLQKQLQASTKRNSKKRKDSDLALSQESDKKP